MHFPARFVDTSVTMIKRKLFMKEIIFCHDISGTIFPVTTSYKVNMLLLINQMF